MSDDKAEGRAQRVVVNLKINLKLGDRQQFEERFSQNISKTGLFVRSKDIVPVGSKVKFEYRLADGSRVMRGLGVVRWVRSEAEGTEESPAGMGIEFVDVDKQTDELITAIVNRYGEGSRAPRKPAKPASVPAPLAAAAASAGAGTLDGEEHDVLDALAEAVERPALRTPAAAPQTPPPQPPLPEPLGDEDTPPETPLPSAAAPVAPEPPGEEPDEEPPAEEPPLEEPPAEEPPAEEPPLQEPPDEEPPAEEPDDTPLEEPDDTPPEAVADSQAAAAVVEARGGGIELPDFGAPDLDDDDEVEVPVEAPEIEVPEIEVPEVELREAPLVELPELELPEVGAAEAEAPELDLDAVAAAPEQPGEELDLDDLTAPEESAATEAEAPSDEFEVDLSDDLLGEPTPQPQAPEPAVGRFPPLAPTAPLPPVAVVPVAKPAAPLAPVVAVAAAPSWIDLCGADVLVAPVGDAATPRAIVAAFAAGDAAVRLDADGVRLTHLLSWIGEKWPTPTATMAARRLGLELVGDAADPAVRTAAGVVSLAAALRAVLEAAAGDKRPAALRPLVPAAASPAALALLRRVAGEAKLELGEPLLDAVALARAASVTAASGAVVLVVDVDLDETRLALLGPSDAVVAARSLRHAGAAEAERALFRAAAVAFLREHGTDVADDPSLQQELSEQLRAARDRGEPTAELTIAGTAIRLSAAQAADALAEVHEPLLAACEALVAKARPTQLVVAADPGWFVDLGAALRDQLGGTLTTLPTPPGHRLRGAVRA